MSVKVKPILFRASIIFCFLIGSLVTLIIWPGLTYAHRSKYKQFSIYHNSDLPQGFYKSLDSAQQTVSKCEVFDTNLKIEICLADGSKYTSIAKAIRPPGFAWSLGNKVVLLTPGNFKGNYIDINGYKWNLIQLIAHEMTHCYQLHYLGIMKSNPVAGIDEWKWEGYPEYVARNQKSQLSLRDNIAHLDRTLKTNSDGWIKFPDGSGTTINYYEHWLLVQYCLEVEKMTYLGLLKDKRSVKHILSEMRHWYKMKI